MAKGNGQIDAAGMLQMNKLVAQFIALRNRIKQLEDIHEKQLAPFKLAKDKLAGVMLEFLDAAGMESARTEAGTVSATVRSSASLPDPDAFMDFVMKRGLFELMDRRANVTACREFAEEHGNLPPGVKINSVRTVGVRVPT